MAVIIRKVKKKMSGSLQDMETVYNAQGRLEGEMIKAFLEAYGIDVILTQESAGSIYGFAVGALGIVEVLVKPELADTARNLLISMEKGDLLISNDLETDENFNETDNSGDHDS